VVIDEAYINFQSIGLFAELEDYPNLVVMQAQQSVGHGWIAIGNAFASVEIIRLLDKIKTALYINKATQDIVAQASTRWHRLNVHDQRTC